MAMTQKQTQILAKLRNKSARTFSRTKKTEPNTGGRLPAGINNGVAILAGYRIDEKNGKPFVVLQGKVALPEEFDGITLKGKNANIRHDLYDMKNKDGEVWRTYEESEAAFLGDVQLLGIETAELNTIEEVFALLDELVDEKPQFVFHTWESKSGYVNTQIDGLFTGTLEEDGEVEAYDEEEEDDGTVHEVYDDEEEEEEEEVEEEEEDEDDLPIEDKSYTVLGTNADAGDDRSIAYLAAKCGEYDLDADDYDTWLGLALTLEDFDAYNEQLEGGEEEESEDQEEEDGEAEEDADSPGEDGEEGSDEEDDEYIPEKGDIFGLVTSRNGTVSECEVTAVFTKKETCNLRRLSDEKLYKNVSWDKLLIQDDD